MEQAEHSKSKNQDKNMDQHQPKPNMSTDTESLEIEPRLEMNPFYSEKFDPFTGTPTQITAINRGKMLVPVRFRTIEDALDFWNNGNEECEVRPFIRHDDGSNEVSDEHVHECPFQISFK